MLVCDSCRKEKGVQSCAITMRGNTFGNKEVTADLCQDCYKRIAVEIVALISGRQPVESSKRKARTS